MYGAVSQYNWLYVGSRLAGVSRVQRVHVESDSETALLLHSRPKMLLSEKTEEVALSMFLPGQQASARHDDDSGGMQNGG
jgi:hypothetical protein